jgi:hypothetical protein
MTPFIQAVATPAIVTSSANNRYLIHRDRLECRVLVHVLNEDTALEDACRGTR